MLYQRKKSQQEDKSTAVQVITEQFFNPIKVERRIGN